MNSASNSLRILLVDDDPCVITVVSKGLRGALPESQVLTARSLAEAQILIAEYQFGFFILDIQLEDGSGIDFLCDIQTTYPDAMVVLITASPLPQYREQANALGVLRFMEKPVDIQALASLIRQRHDRSEAGKVETKSTAEPHFEGALSRLTPIDIIQLKCLGRATGALDFISDPHGRGRIFIRAGEIIHAQMGDIHGEDAFYYILGWRSGRVVEVPEMEMPTQTIFVSWQNLLLQAAQFLDEHTASP